MLVLQAVAAEEVVHDRSRQLEAQIKEVEEKKVTDTLPLSATCCCSGRRRVLRVCPAKPSPRAQKDVSLLENVTEAIKKTLGRLLRPSDAGPSPEEEVAAAWGRVDQKKDQVREPCLADCWRGVAMPC